MLIQGISVLLFEKQEAGRDGFNRPVYTEKAVRVDNVLIEPLSSDPSESGDDMSGRKSVCLLCLPKGDSHDWTDRDVEFYGKRWHTTGEVMEWIESMVPLSWNKKVRCERIDGGYED